MKSTCGCGAYTSGTQGVIVAEDFHPQNMFLEMQARVSGPQDKLGNGANAADRAAALPGDRAHSGAADATK